MKSLSGYIKRAMTILLSGAMVLTAVPQPVYADMIDEDGDLLVVEDAKETIVHDSVADDGEDSVVFENSYEKTVTFSETSQEDPDALLEGYINQLVKEEKYDADEISNDGVARRESLGAINKYLYDFLAGKAVETAKGDVDSTVFRTGTIDLKTVYGGKTSFTKDELGVSDLRSQAATDAALAKMGSDIDAVIDALLSDYPYDLYWWDKSSGYRWNPNPSGSISSDKLTIESLSYTFELYVSVNYSVNSQRSTTNVNTAKTRAASNTVTRATQVVNNAISSGCTTDYQKLKYYKKYICDNTSYNYDALSGVSYGDPWQLIYVFDGDPSTKVVCEGYSKAFKLLCDLSTFSYSSFDCYLMTGNMNGGAHMWNTVKMNDGKYYLVDVTNCDTDAYEAHIGDIEDDRLFLVGSSSPSATSFYISKPQLNMNDGYYLPQTSVHYSYDSETTKQFSAAERTIAGSNYDPSSVTVPDPDPDPEPEDPQPEDPQPEDPQPENPQPEDPQPENPQPEDPQPEDPEPEEISVRVTLDANGGSLNSNQITVVYDSAYGELPTPRYEGYYFEGWFTARTGGEKVFGTTKVTNKNAHTLYAHWSRVEEGSVVFDKHEITLASLPGSRETITATVKGSGYSASTLIWSSSNNRAATVANGVVTAVTGLTEEATTRITAETPDHKYKDTCRVTVTPAEQVESPTANIDSGEVDFGTTITLTCATPDAYIYCTLDGSAPSLDSQGRPVGTTRLYTGGLKITEDILIRAFAAKEGYKNSNIVAFLYAVKQEPDPEDPYVPVEPGNSEDPEIQSIKLDMVVVEGGKINDSSLAKTKADGKQYKISIDNKKIATVNSKGQIQGKKAGTTKATVTKKDIEYRLNITVVKAGFTAKTYKINTGEKVMPVFTSEGVEISSFKSSNTSVAEVYLATDGLYIVTFNKGTTKLTAVCNGKKYTATVKVYDPTIKGTDTLLLNNKAATLSVKNGCGKTTWESDDTSVVTVNGGKIKGVSKGTATITAKNNGRVMTKVITVYNVPKFEYKMYYTDVDSPVEVTFIYDEDMGDPVYSVSNKKVAAIDENGILTPLKKGTVTVTAAIGGKKYKTKVKITK